MLLFHFTQLKCETRSKNKERNETDCSEWYKKKQNSETEQANNRKTKQRIFIEEQKKNAPSNEKRKEKNKKNGHLTHRIIYVSLSIHSFAYQTRKIEQKNWTCVYLIYCYGYYKYKLPKKNSIFWMYHSISTQKNNIHRFHTLSSSFSCTTFKF